MGWLYKKSEAATTLLIIIVIVFFLGWLINVGQRECKSNRDCGSESYCGSDFSCHSYPTIQKTVVKYNLFWPAVIIGVAIIIAAIIYRQYIPIPKEEKKRIVEEEVPKKTETQEQEVENISEPYYKSDSNARTP